MSVFSFVGAFAASAFLGGGSLPYKIYHPVVTGVIGLTFLISVLIKRPLVLALARAFAPQNSEQLDRVEKAWNTPAGRRKFTFMTAVTGLVCLGSSVAHIFMALTLSTVTYLVMSRVITVVVIAILLGARWIVSRRGK